MLMGKYLPLMVVGWEDKTFNQKDTYNYIFNNLVIDMVLNKND